MFTKTKKNGLVRCSKTKDAYLQVGNVISIPILHVLEGNNQRLTAKYLFLTSINDCSLKHISKHRIYINEPNQTTKHTQKMRISSTF